VAGLGWASMSDASAEEEMGVEDPWWIVGAAIVCVC
jgi:hypothetical protein